MKKLIPLLLLSSLANANLISTADVKAYPAVGIHGNYTPIQCTHHIYVTNNSNQAETGIAYYRVCAQGKQCQEVKKEQRMEPHVNWEHSFTSQYAFAYVNPGNYSLTCSTSIQSSAYKDDVNNISIS